MDEINEASTAIVTVSFLNENDAAVTPTKAYYSLYCKTTSTVIKAETELTGLGTTKDIEITAAENAIQNSSNSKEIKVLTVRFTYNAGARQGTGCHEYAVINLSQIS